MKQKQKKLLVILFLLFLQTGNVQAASPDEHIIVEEAVIGGDEDAQETPAPAQPQPQTTTQTDSKTQPADSAKTEPQSTQSAPRQKKNTHQPSAGSANPDTPNESNTIQEPQTISSNQIFHTPMNDIETNAFSHAYLDSFDHTRSISRNSIIPEDDTPISDMPTEDDTPISDMPTEDDTPISDMPTEDDNSMPDMPTEEIEYAPFFFAALVLLLAGTIRLLVRFLHRK